MSKWLEWERQATVHSIVMCIEAWTEPVKREYGKPWPTIIAIYNKDIVSWYDPWDELLGYGQYAINRFVKGEERDKLIHDINKRANELDKLFEKFEKIDFDKLTDNELELRYRQLYDGYVSWFVPGGLVEPVGHQSEQLLRELLENKLRDESRSEFPSFEELFSVLTTTTLESFSKRQLLDLLKIASRKNIGEEITIELEEHAKKYFWLSNNYYSTEILDLEFFENELKTVMKDYPNPQKQIVDMEKDAADFRLKKNQLVKQMALDDFNTQLIELVNFFGYYSDYRKEYVMKMLHFLDLILAEIGKRRGFSLKQMKYTLPEEIASIIDNDGSFKPDIIEKRMERFLYHVDSKTGKVEHGFGNWSFEKQKEIFGLKVDHNVLEVSGMVASRGSVIGRARVTMSATKANEIGEGEILITSMTSPDFVPAMKKALAIVTNEGGILCHAAVVSREFGIPCIVGTKIATKIFKTGDRIEVDGELGIVRKVS